MIDTCGKGKLTKLEGQLLIRVLELLRQQCLQLEGNLTETSSILIDVDDALSEEMGKMREHPAIVEEKARRIWIPKIKEECEKHG